MKWLINNQSSCQLLLISISSLIDWLIATTLCEKVCISTCVKPIGSLVTGIVLYKAWPTGLVIMGHVLQGLLNEVDHKHVESEIFFFFYPVSRGVPGLWSGWRRHNQTQCPGGKTFSTTLLEDVFTSLFVLLIITFNYCSLIYSSVWCCSFVRMHFPASKMVLKDLTSSRSVSWGQT